VVSSTRQLLCNTCADRSNRNPPDIVQKWLDTDYNAKSRAAAFFAGCGLVTSQLAINTIDNAFSAGMDIAGLFPKYINIRRGAYIGLVLSIALCPWQLLSSAATFISVLSAYSVFLGPMTGIMICDYWVVRRGKLKLSDLYHGRKDGSFYFWRGINWRSFTAWIIGWSYLIPGFVKAVAPEIHVPVACTNLYYLAFPLGFAVSFATYYGLNLISPPQGLRTIDEVDDFGTFTTDEAQKLGIAPVILHGDAQAFNGGSLVTANKDEKSHA
jgi:NCS1 family nucleobase:cation symporter-1